MKTYPKLRGRIVELYGSQRLFAKAIHKSEQTVVYKLTGKYSFSQEDIIEWGNALNISKEEVGEFFFADKL